MRKSWVPKLLFALSGFFVLQVYGQATPHFLTLPFRNPDVKIQQGWRYNFGDQSYCGHQAIDYVNGTVNRSETWKSFEVYPAADGEATLRNSDTLGDYVTVKTVIGNEIYYTLYAHLDSTQHTLIKDVHRNVTRADRIGMAGKTGTASNGVIHLHFELSRNDFARGGNYPLEVKNQCGNCRIDPYGIYDRRPLYPTSPDSSCRSADYYWTQCVPNSGSTTPPPNSSLSWEFNTNGNFEGWNAINISGGPGNYGATVNNGILFIDPAGIDPFITSPPFTANASVSRFVRIRMASNAVDGYGNVYFMTQSDPSYTADKRVEFAVNVVDGCPSPTCEGNAPFLEYSVDMWKNPFGSQNLNEKWTGTITGIRIDPANDGRAGTNTDTVGFDYIKLLPGSIFASGIPDPNPPFVAEVFSNSTSYAVNENIPLYTVITATGSGAADVIVDTEIYNSANQKVFQSFVEHQNFAASESKQFVINWVPSVAGQYRVKTGVFTSSWLVNYQWNDDALDLNVGGTNPTPTPPPATYNLDIWWPTNGATVSGTVPFKAMLTNMPVSQYVMYWQVDNGQLNLMPDSFQDYPHKEYSVDVSGWTWRGNGPYHINFVAKDLNGNFINQAATDIYISR